MPAAVVVGLTAYSMYEQSRANRSANRVAQSQAEMNYQLGQDTLEYYRGRDAQSAALQGQANAIAGRVANAQIKLMDLQYSIAKQTFDRQKSVFWPLENEFIKEAKSYDTKERRDSEAANAISGIEHQYTLTQDALQRDQRRRGVDPSSGNQLAMETSLGLNAASAKAGAANAARKDVESTGRNMRLQAIGLGSGLASQQASAASTAVGAGSAAVNTAYQPVYAFNSNNNMAQGIGLASGLMNNASNIQYGAYKNQADQWGQTASGLASMAGRYYGMT